MKKHISIAALLVAGTSLANAGTASFTFNSPIDGATNITVNSGSTETITGSLDTVVSGAKFELSQGGDSWDSVKGDIISFYNTPSSVRWNNDVLLSEISSVSGVSVEALKTITQGVGNYFTFKNPQVVTLSGLDANTEYSITTIWGPVNNSWKLDFTQGTFVEGHYGYVCSSGNSSDVEWEKFEELSGPSSGFKWYGVKTVVRSDGTGTISFNTSSRSEISFLSVSTIPEPSAFGLLAGLGALALTVSRRRRK